VKGKPPKRETKITMGAKSYERCNTGKEDHGKIELGKGGGELFKVEVT
jgi:hypothetical protein